MTDKEFKELLQEEREHFDKVNIYSLFENIMSNAIQMTSDTNSELYKSSTSEQIGAFLSFAPKALLHATESRISYTKSYEATKELIDDELKRRGQSVQVH
jgi:hypothetical protein